MGAEEQFQQEEEERRRESDIELIRQGAHYEITGVPLELADKLIQEQKGESFLDLASFIRAKKVIGCPKENLSAEAAKELEDAMGEIRASSFGELYFIDSTGNIATLEIKPSKIESLANTGRENNFWNTVRKELEDAGFKPYCENGELIAGGPLYDTMFRAVQNHREEAAKKPKGEFNF